MPPRLPVSLALTVVALSAGCARALKPPPPLADLGGRGAPVFAGSIDEAGRRAQRLYATRDLEDVRKAAELWLQVAKSDRTEVEGLVGVARANVWLATHEERSEDRLRAARLAVQAAQWCERIEPDSPVCAYWLGAGLGLQARERRTTALDALPRIMNAFERAAMLEPSYERGGPDRALALVYARAPGWPTGPGDPDLALLHARKAVALQPEYPPNHLALGEALDATGNRAGSRAAYERALDLAHRIGESDPDAAEWIREAEEALGSRKGA
jgi:tetratricopeptide (TPR) repeat protein